MLSDWKQRQLISTLLPARIGFVVQPSAVTKSYTDNSCASWGACGKWSLTCGSAQSYKMLKLPRRSVANLPKLL